MKRFLALAAAVASLSLACLCACAQGENYQINVSDAEHGKVFAVQNTARAGEKVRLSCLPEIGYKLTGFTVDGEKIDGNTFIMPEGGVQVCAEFGLITYSITYVGGDPQGNPTSYTVEDWGTALTQPDKDGYDEGGWYCFFTENDWYLDGLEDFKAETISKGTIGNLTLYARKYNVPHEITADDSLDVISVWADPYEAVAGDRVSLEYSLYSKHYEFICFTVNGEDIEGDSFIMGHEPAEISAKVRPLEYTITYDLDGGVLEEDNPITYTAESGKITLAPPVKEGFEFVGWDMVDGEGGYYNNFYIDQYGDEDGYIYIDVNLLLDYGDITLQAYYL